MNTQNLSKPGAYRMTLKVAGAALVVGAISLASVMLTRSLINVEALPGIRVTQGPPNF